MDSDTRQERPAPDGESAGEGKSFEENMARLEKLVGQLERGELSLEDALKCYQEGVALVGQCRQSLERAAAAVEVLTDSMNRTT
ncbi:MAG: exodeoxyribonuclease VII small subunit [Clostridiales bacterium]|nr:exodeoxyribonuclease VII small subunit [Clostridiales bacterium]